jgi:hypothetical protein
VRENLGDFRKSIKILTFFPHYLMSPYLSQNERADLKKDAINEFGIKY